MTSDRDDTTLPGGRCPPIQWAVPTPASADTAQGAVARFASLAVGSGGRRFVVGNDIMFFDAPSVPAAPLAAWDERGQSIGRPAGPFSFILPRAAVDASGRLHLLWGEPAEAPRSRPAYEWPLQAVQVWTASYTPDGGWSVAEKLYQGEPIGWEFATLSDPSTTGSSEIVVAASRKATALGGGVLLARFDGLRWATSEVPFPWPLAGPLYPSAVVRVRRLFLAFISADPDADSDVNSVWLRASADGGASWEAPRLVSRSGSTPALDVHVLAGPNDELRFVWLQNVTVERGPGAPAVVRQMLSRDAGAAWLPPSDLGGAGPRGRVRAAVDRCGRTHVLFEDISRGADASRLAHAVWDGRWSAQTALFPSLLAFDPDLRVERAATGERLVLAFVGRPADAAWRASLQTLLSATSADPAQPAPSE